MSKGERYFHWESHTENRKHACPWNPGTQAPPPLAAFNELLSLQLKQAQDKGKSQPPQTESTSYGTGSGYKGSAGALAQLPRPLSPHVDRRGPWTAWSNGRTHCSAKQWLFRCEVNYTAESLRICAARGRAEMQSYYQIKDSEIPNSAYWGGCKGCIQGLNPHP